MAFGIGRKIKKTLKPQKAEQFDYIGDNIAVRKKNLGFMNDVSFSQAWEKAVEGNRPAWGGRYKDVRWRAHTAVWAAKHGLTLEGDFVECGVFLGRVDGFDQDEGGGDCDDGAEVSCGFFAAQGDAFKAFELPHHLFDACAAPVERFGEVPGNVAPV